MIDEETISFTAALRGYYSADNRVGLLLDEVIADMRAGSSREHILAEAKSIAAEFPHSTVARTIEGRILPALNATD